MARRCNGGLRELCVFSLSPFLVCVLYMQRVYRIMNSIHPWYVCTCCVCVGAVRCVLLCLTACKPPGMFVLATIVLFSLLRPRRLSSQLCVWLARAPAVLPRGVCCLAWRGVAWRGVAWRGVARVQGSGHGAMPLVLHRVIHRLVQQLSVSASPPHYS